MHKGYEEVIVPAMRQSGLGEEETLVDVSTMPAWAQSAFEGYKCACPVRLSCPCCLSGSHALPCQLSVSLGASTLLQQGS